MNNARTLGKLHLAWLSLLALTLLGGFIGEMWNSGLWVSVTVALIMAIKARLVIDHFMELGDAHPAIRGLVRFFALFFPLLVVVTYLFGDQIAQLTGL